MIFEDFAIFATEEVIMAIVIFAQIPSLKIKRQKYFY